MDTIPQLNEIIERGRQAAEERKRQEELDAIARQEEEERKRDERLAQAKLPLWMSEYTITFDYDGDNAYSVNLPGCSPIQFVIFYRHGDLVYSPIRVKEATGLAYSHASDAWIVTEAEHVFRNADNLDEAIALAAEYGESWHAMKAEAERRNAEGLRPEPPTPAEPEPTIEKAPTINDLIAEALESRIYGADHRATGVIDALIVIAAELRGIRYTLAKLLKEEAR